jgi:hypothetical protein
VKLFSIIVLSLLIISCGTLQHKADRLSNGDSFDEVEVVMGKPDDVLVNNEQVLWRYCVSGAGFGFNDHKDILFKNAELKKISHYQSTVTGCTNGFQPANWLTVGLGIDLDSAIKNCEALGFKKETEGMSNCLLKMEEMEFDRK